MFHHHIGANHPIDIASREICINYLKDFNKNKQNVVLEIGCSSGYLINKIKMKKKYNYIGSDAVKNHIVKLSEKYKDVPFLIFDLLKNPFKKPICDALIMLNVLEHIKNDDAALLEANKILNDNGVLIIEVPAGKFLYGDYDKKLKQFRRYNMGEITKKIEKAGFTIERKTHLGFIVYPLFVIVKLFNKLFKDKNIVIKQVKNSNNFFTKMFFNLEKKLYKINFPFGIRCYICARKLNNSK